MRVVRRQAGVRVGARRLDDEHIGGVDGLVEAAVDLAGRERLERDRSELDPELLGRRSRKAGVGTTGEKHQALLSRHRGGFRRRPLFERSHGTAHSIPAPTAARSAGNVVTRLTREPRTA